MIFLSLQNYSISPKYCHQYPKKCRSCPKLAYFPSFFPLFSTKCPLFFSLLFYFSHLFFPSSLFFSFLFLISFCLFSLSLFFLSFTSSPSPSFPFSSTARCGGACLVTVQSDSVALLPRVSFPPFLPSKTPSSLRFLPAKHPKTG